MCVHIYCCCGHMCKVDYSSTQCHQVDVVIEQLTWLCSPWLTSTCITVSVIIVLQHDKCRLLHWFRADLFWRRFGENQSCAAACYGHFRGDNLRHQWVHPAFCPWGKCEYNICLIYKSTKKNYDWNIQILITFTWITCEFFKYWIYVW